MPDLVTRLLRRGRTRLDLRTPSRRSVQPLERIGCRHVSDGAPVSGFTRISLVGQEVFLDLCAACSELARQGVAIAHYGDRRSVPR